MEKLIWITVYLHNYIKNNLITVSILQISFLSVCICIFVFQKLNNLFKKHFTGILW